MGEFREDLYYRLKVVPIRMPPLRERGRDVALLAARLLERQAEAAGREGMRFTREAIELMMAYGWPGNVRELVNAVEFVVALARDDVVGPAELPPELLASVQPAAPRPRAPRPGESPEELEAAAIREALERNDWHRLKTAEELGINRVTLYRQMKRYGIEGPRGRRRR